jgi:hypothetical protein
MLTVDRLAYFVEQYETINWAASYLAFGFAVEALLLLWVGVAYGLSFGPRSHPTGRAGLALFLFALGVQPLIGPLLGRPWTQAEVFGIAPDPTAIATLGILLTADGRARWELLAIPVIWCVISSLTLWTMGSPDAPMPALFACLAVLLAMWKPVRETCGASRDRSERMRDVAT